MRGGALARPQPAGRLYRKYALVFVSLVGGALLASGLLELAFTYEENTSALNSLQRAKASTAAAWIEAFLTEIQHQIASTSTTPGDTLAERRDAYLRLLRTAPAVTDLRYLDRTGAEQVRVSRVSLNAIATGTNYSSSPSFTEARPGQTRFSQVYFRDESEPYMTISVPETTPGGGVTLADVNLKFIWDVVSRIQIGTRGYAYVVDGSGHLIAHQDISRVLQRTDYSFLPQVELARPGRAPSSAEADPPGERATIASGEEGGPVLSAYTQIKPTGWWVFVEQPLDEAFGPLIAALMRTVVLLLAGLVVSILAGLFLARTMVRPIHALHAGAARIGAGALEQRIEVHTGDELERLADAFNAMASQLAGSYAELEQRVAQRTSELRAALCELEHKSQDLEAASRHKSEFLANMSHELRTPLNAIIGFSEMLLLEMFGSLNDKQREYLNDVLDSGHHLLSLINDILDLSKVEAGEMVLDRSTFALREVLECGMLLLREHAARHRLSLTLEVDPELGLVDGDERKIKQVIVNLMANAVKFTPDGGRVHVAGRLVNGEAWVSVQDTGIGIAPTDQLRVFEPFQQAVQPSSGQISMREGTGLGLALVKRLVELHGGRIWVASQPALGSTFTFALPVTVAMSHATAMDACPPAVVDTERNARRALLRNAPGDGREL